MEIDINFALAYYTTNVNVYEFSWKSYGTAIWFDTRIETHREAWERAHTIVWDEIYHRHPHLIGTNVRFSDTGELPTIQLRDR